MAGIRVSVATNRASSNSSSKRQVAQSRIEGIISGGQTGADQAALDVAIECGIPHAGWCPQGRLSENGEIASAYVLRETPDSNYSQRTKWNVRDSDGTVILSIASELSGGSKTTAEFATLLNKPWLHVSRERDGKFAVDRLRRFVVQHSIRILNVAGPRASGEPEVADFVKSVLRQAVV